MAHVLFSVLLPLVPPSTHPFTCRYETGDVAHVLFSVGVAPGSPECQALEGRLNAKGYSTVDISGIELAQVRRSLQAVNRSLLSLVWVAAAAASAASYMLGCSLGALRRRLPCRLCQKVHLCHPVSSRVLPTLTLPLSPPPATSLTLQHMSPLHQTGTPAPPGGRPRTRPRRRAAQRAHLPGRLP